jgi:undecaprenyl-diphosphatase
VIAIPLGEGAVLGLVQGITEFLPVSSAGHLALAQLLYGGDPEVATTALLHVGTLAATLVVLRKRVWNAIEEGLRGLGRPALLAETPGGQDASFVAIATVPTVVVGLALKHELERLAVVDRAALGADAASGSLTLIGICFLVTALVVVLARLAPGGTKTPLGGPRSPPGATTPGWMGALLVGAAQGTAVLPGVSRSAVTIASLLWMGVGAERAFELSFLASIPAIVGAIAIESHHALRGDEAPGALAVGMAVAFVVGLGGLYAMRRVVLSGKLQWFSFYLVPVAIATLAWGYARP